MKPCGFTLIHWEERAKWINRGLLVAAARIVLDGGFPKVATLTRNKEREHGSRTGIKINEQKQKQQKRWNPFSCSNLIVLIYFNFHKSRVADLRACAHFDRIVHFTACCSIEFIIWSSVTLWFREPHISIDV